MKSRCNKSCLSFLNYSNFFFSIIRVNLSFIFRLLTKAFQAYEYQNKEIASKKECRFPTPNSEFIYRV